MNTIKILKYQLQDTLRSRWVFLYGLFFFVVADAFFRFGGGGERVILSLMNVVLLMVPLVGIVLGAMYLYGSREYIELLLAQPIRRRSLFQGLFAGLTLPLSLAFVLGIGLPFVYHGGLAGSAGALAFLLFTGILLTVVFVALGFGIALWSEDRIRGLGLALATWMFFAVIFDGLILLVIQLFQSYPLEQPVIALSLLNPIDLGRILLLLNLDVSALMGFTGAVFQRFFGTLFGQVVTVGALLVWLGVPYFWGQRTFLGKNF